MKDVLGQILTFFRSLIGITFTLSKEINRCIFHDFKAIFADNARCLTTGCVPLVVSEKNKVTTVAFHPFP